MGGEGTRLRPLTLDLPKQLLPVAGVTMLERVLGPMADIGMEDVVLSLGYRPDAFVAAFPTGRVCGVPLHYAVEAEPLGTGGAIRYAAECAGMTNDTLLVRNGDVIADVDLAALVDFHRSSGALATISLTSVEDPSAFGLVLADDDGLVREFIEKPAPGMAPTSFVNAGIYVLEPEVLAMIEPGRAVSVEREIFPALAARSQLYALPFEGYWLDAGTPEKYLKANRDVVTGSAVTPPVDGATELGEPGSTIWATGIPSGSVYEGRHIVGRHALVQDAVVGDGVELVEAVVGRGATLGPGAKVVRSVILDGAKVGAGALIEDSIVGRGASIGDGAYVTAHSVIGADCVIDPGEHLVGQRVPA